MFAPKQPQSAVSRPVRIKCDDPRRPIVAECLAKELLRGLDVAMLAQAKVDRPAALVDSAIQVDPFATDFDVGFIHAPRAADWTRESLPSFFEFGHIALRPPQQCRMRDGDSAFSHHFREIAIRKLIRDVPTHAQDDEFLLEVTALEERIGIAWRSLTAWVPRGLPIKLYPLMLTLPVCARTIESWESSLTHHRAIRAFFSGEADRHSNRGRCESGEGLDRDTASRHALPGHQ